MGHLVTRISRPVWTQSIKSGNGRLAQTSRYNSSSLALEWEETPFPVSQPMPQVISRRNIQTSAEQNAVTWRGLDLDAYNKGDKTSSATAFVIHFLVLILILRLGMVAHNRIVQADVKVTPLNFTLYAPPPPPPVVMKVAKLGGGGGGAHQMEEPPKGHPPAFVKMPTLAPQILRIDQPKLAVEPGISVKIPDSSNLPNVGVSNSPKIALVSQGSGSGSGFGIGMGGGIGSGRGSGYGSGVMSVGGGVSAPQLIHSVDPDFTEEARQANFQGTASIQLIVDSQGNPQDIHVVRHLGMGLDEKAMDAVRQYRFRPAMYQGHAVAVQMLIEVDFRLH
jgi:TonB family protein